MEGEDKVVSEDEKMEASEFGPMVSSDPDDATAVTGNQQIGTHARMSIGAVSGLTTAPEFPHTTLPGNAQQKIHDEAQGGDKKPSTTTKSKDSSTATSSFASLASSA